MNIERIQWLEDKRFFTVKDFSEKFEIALPSARVQCARYVRNGFLIRLKRDWYTLEQNWRRWGQSEFFLLANYLQVPSYISYMTALTYYNKTTQVHVGLVESAVLKRTRRFSIEGIEFRYYKLRQEHYFSFEKVGELFIATPEKALLDAIYLTSIGKYRFDQSSIDFAKFDKKLILNLMKLYPPKTKQMVTQLSAI